MVVSTTPPHLSFVESTVARAYITYPQPLRERVNNTLQLNLGSVDLCLIAPKGPLGPRAGNLPRRRKPGQKADKTMKYLSLLLSPELVVEDGFFGRP